MLDMEIPVVVELIRIITSSSVSMQVIKIAVIITLELVLKQDVQYRQVHVTSSLDLKQVFVPAPVQTILD